MSHQKDTSGRKPKLKAAGPDLFEIFSLAGEVHRLIVSAGETSSGPPPHPKADGAIPERARPFLQVDCLDDFFRPGGPQKAERDWSFSPAEIQKTIPGLGERLARLGEETSKAERILKGIQTEIHKVLGKRARCLKDLELLDGRYRQGRINHNRLEKEFRNRKEAVARHLADLEVQLNRLAENIDQARTKNRSGRWGVLFRRPGRPNPKELTQRRSEYGVIKTEWSRQKADLDQVRAAARKNAAELLELKSERARLKYLIKEGRCSERILRIEAAQAQAGLASRFRESNKIRQARANLDQAEQVWAALRVRLLEWPQACAELARKTARISPLSPEESWGTIKVLQKRIAATIQAQTKLAEEGADWAETVNDLAECFDKIHQASQGLGQDLGQATLTPPSLSDDPGEGLEKQFVRRIQVLKQNRTVLLTRLSDLKAAWTEKVRAMEALEKERAALVHRLRAEVRQVQAGIRAQATRRYVFQRKAERTRHQLGQLYFGLKPLLGRDSFLDRCVLAGALGLARTDRTLKSLQENLALEHDRLSAALKSSSLTPRPPHPLKNGLARLDELARRVDLWPDLDHRLAEYQRAMADQAKNMLAEDKKRLTKMIGGAAARIRRLEDEKRRLVDDLTSADLRTSRLTGYLKDELLPLTQALGLALFQNQVRYEDLQQKQTALALKLTESAGRIVDLEKDNRRARAASDSSAQALVWLSLEMDRRERRRRIELDRTSISFQEKDARIAQLEQERQELEAEHLESLRLGRAQAIKAASLESRLAELQDLVQFFLDQVNLWARSPMSAQVASADPCPVGSEYLVALVHILNQENENLKAGVARLNEDRLAKNLELEHIERSHRLMRDRLGEVLPLLSYFWPTWLKNTTELAEALAHRRILLEKLKVEKAGVRNLKQKIEGLTAELGGKTAELADAKSELSRTRAEKTEALRNKTASEIMLRQSRTKVKALDKTRAGMVNDLEKRALRIATLEMELTTLGDRARLMEAEADRRGQRAASLSLENESLKTKAADQAGKFEAAVSGLFYLADRTGAERERLRNRLAAQADTVRRLEAQLAERSRRVSDLEKIQDQLGLLLWLTVKFGGSDEEVWAALDKLTREKGFRDAAEIVGLRLSELTLAAVTHLKSEEFRRTTKRAVRRGFYSLVLAGGIVLNTPNESSKATAIPTIFYGPPEAPYSLTDVSAVKPSPLQGPFYSHYVGRIFDLGFLSPEERAKGFGHLQNLIKHEIDSQAGHVGLSPEDYINLVRRHYEPGRVVSLGHLGQECADLSLLKDFFPGIYADHKGTGLEDRRLRALYRLARRAGERECRFWDRLYSDFRSLETGADRSLAMILSNIRLHQEERRKAEPMVFTGRLRPIPALEKVSLEQFTKVLAPYFRQNINKFISPTDQAGREMDQLDVYTNNLAEDIYMSGKIFGVPVTLMVAIAHQESYFANVLGDNSLSASPFQIYRPTKSVILKSMTQKGFQVPQNTVRLQDHLTLATYMAAYHLAWLMEKHVAAGPNQAGRCNLDRVAKSYNGGEAYPPAVHRKKRQLVDYLNGVLSTAGRESGQPRG